MSASATWRASASASLNTATERIPIWRSVRITRTAISPRLATRTVEKFTTSHPEHAVGDRFDRRLAHHRKRQSENGSGVGGVDDAVVPQPSGRIVRVALAFVLLADRGLEVLLLLGRHLAADGGQHQSG